MSRSTPTPAFVHVEYLLHCVHDGAAVNAIAIVASDDPALLAQLREGHGYDDTAPLELSFSIGSDATQPQLLGHFNRPAGHRLRAALQVAIGDQWRWLPPKRTRRTRTMSGHAGAVYIPVQQLWVSWNGEVPEPATAESLDRLGWEWNAKNGLEFCNDRVVAIELPRAYDKKTAHCESEIVRIINNLTDPSDSPNKTPAT
ncbi:hypothetical protein I6J77_01025 [Rhodanobacter sp. FDAARGOS 1247]|uniref:hypothetical protein n=1 Tax=Rhodanobacter sp. FDAARGOS 1247 TaxID=2778082 RepID=UPI0019515E19|nr:hypothetical protein [Rhodanobacter sp. FDAARGOS 1247]QRP64088.1 hypothetical protein I6J77_01025 [Rhodanobacter sp. FDAARGOS 1247]